MNIHQTKSHKHPARWARGILLFSVVIGCIAAAPGLRAETNFVTQAGSFGPIRNDSSQPFSLVETATRALPASGGTVLIAPGMYRQKDDLVLDHPATLEKNPAGGAGVPVIGGHPNVIASTTLNVLTWNCRLFDPDFPFTGSQKWMDEWRARHVGWYLRLRRSELDIVTLCEVWDYSGADTLFDLVSDPLRTDYDGGTEMLSVTEDLSAFPGFAFSKYNDNPGLNPNQNSGLAMFSNWPILASYGYPDGRYSDCDGIDCRASKGWMALKIAKDGFEICVIDTHTQAQDSDDAVDARNNQFAQLATYIESYRNANPGIPVILMGDFNVIAETGNSSLHATYDILRQKLGTLGGKDIVRHTPKFERILDLRMKAVGGAPNSMTISTNLVHADYRSVYTWKPNATQFGSFLEDGNELSYKFDHTPNERLDYVVCFASKDAKVLIEPEEVEVIVVKKRDDTDGGFTSDEVSDHYPLKARLRLTRIQ